MKLKFNTQLKFGNRVVSAENPAFIIAEAGVNHNGDINLAYKLIDAAVEAQVDAVKFQIFKTEALILEDVEKAPYQKRTTGAKTSQFEMLKKLELTIEQFEKLKKYCDDKKVMFLITPFDEESLEDLDQLDLAGYKISSTDLTNLPFLRKVAKKNKPIIISSGMSYLEEIKLALQELSRYNDQIALLHCTGNYPAKDDEINLNVFQTFKEHFDMILGYSDHTVGIGASPYTLPLGAKILEKHFTLDKSMEGPDHEASLDPEELKDYVVQIRRVETFLGSAIKAPQASEEKTRLSLQKSLVAKCHIPKGSAFSEENLIAKRCGGVGISPIRFNEIVKEVAKQDFEKNQIINL